MFGRQLALRDTAALIMFGAMAAGEDPNFGAEGAADFGSEFGDDDYGDEGDDYGYDWGADFGAVAKRARAHAAARVARAPNPNAMMAKWQAQQMATAHRESLLEPNKHSTVKIERYVFPISQSITLGTAVALALNNNPDVTIRPQRITMNAPAPMFATISEIKVANVSVTIGGASVVDAFDFNANGQDQALDLPTLSPQNRATVTGNYTGFVPSGFVGATAVYFVVSFKGPASIVA